MLAYLKLAALAASAAVCFGGGWVVHGWRADAAELARTQAAERRRIDNADRAEWAGSNFEATRDAIRARIEAPQPRADAAMATLVCPDVAARDVVLPLGLLDRIRAAAGDEDPGEPRPAVPVRPADPAARP